MIRRTNIYGGMQRELKSNSESAGILSYWLASSLDETEKIPQRSLNIQHRRLRPTVFSFVNPTIRSFESSRHITRSRPSTTRGPADRCCTVLKALTILLLWAFQPLRMQPKPSSPSPSVVSHCGMIDWLLVQQSVSCILHIKALFD